jgi:hypothetical protein
MGTSFDNRFVMIGAPKVGHLTRSRVLWIIFATLVVRLAIVAWFESGFSVMPQPFLSERYFQEGYAISAGWGYSTGSDDAYAKATPLQKAVERGEVGGRLTVPRPAGFYGETLHPPGMALLVAAMHTIFGGAAKIPTMILGALLDTFAAIVLFWMVKTAWSERVGFLTALTYALFLPQAYAATAGLSPDGLETFFVIAAFACVIRAVRTIERRRYYWFVCAGLLIGLGGFLRPDYDLLALGLFPFLWLYFNDGWQAAKATLLMTVITYVTLLPWAYENHKLYGRWIFTSTAVGSTMMEGLGEFRNPWGFSSSDVELSREAQKHGFASAWSPEGSDYFNAKFIAAVEQHPLAYVVSVAKRLPLAFAPAYQFGYANPLKTKAFSQQRASGLDRYEAVLKNPLYVVAAYWDALLFAGISIVFLGCSVYMLWSERRELPLVALLMAPHLYGIGVHIVSELEPRYLLPSMFSLMIGFAYFIQLKVVRGRVEEAPGSDAVANLSPLGGREKSLV